MRQVIKFISVAILAVCTSSFPWPSNDEEPGKLEVKMPEDNSSSISNRDFIFPKATNESSFLERLQAATRPSSLPSVFQYPTEEARRLDLPIWTQKEKADVSEEPDDKVIPGKDSQLINMNNFRPTLSKDGKPLCTELENPGNAATFCAETNDYPQAYIASQRIGVLLGDDRIISPRTESNYTQEQTVCTAVEVLIYPKMAQQKDRNWGFIVNTEEYIQGVQIDKCRFEGEECSLGIGAPTGYKTVCRQKYVYRKLIGLKADGKVTPDSFRLPSCCVCYVMSDFVLDRIHKRKQDKADTTTVIAETDA